jgi:Ca2+-binding EF-hand superfamily protein
MEYCDNFTKADTNKNGFLEPKEIMDFYKMKKEEVDEVFKKYDVNKDGKLDRMEHFKWRANLEFVAKDTSKDGFLQPEEIMKGYNMKKEAVDELFKKYDVNKDGKLSFCEFKKWKLSGAILDRFKALDTNKNGFLEPAEIMKGMGMKKEQVDKIFKDFDKNKDGKLSVEEWKEYNMKLHFDRLDTNKNGTLEKKELMTAWQLDEKKVTEIMNKYDTNKDGKISFEEYKKMWIW